MGIGIVNPGYAATGTWGSLAGAYLLNATANNTPPPSPSPALVILAYTLVLGALDDALTYVTPNVVAMTSNITSFAFFFYQYILISTLLEPLLGPVDLEGLPQASVMNQLHQIKPRH